MWTLGQYFHIPIFPAGKKKEEEYKDHTKNRSQSSIFSRFFLVLS